jgi:hypothetical protein
LLRTRRSSPLCGLVDQAPRTQNRLRKQRQLAPLRADKEPITRNATLRINMT